ncbi:MAG: BatD family protein [Rhodothermaceae bacterium]
MKNRKFILLVISLLIFSTGKIFSQQLNATVNKSIVEQYERFQIDFSFKANKQNGIEGFQAPELKNFRILTGPNQSTSMQIVNGAVSSNIIYSYIVVCDKIGNYTIGQASVKFDGTLYTSKPIKIKVVKGDPNKKKKSSSGQVSTAELNKNVFILAVPDKRRVSKGEQVTVSYKLYTKMNISTPQITKLPTYKGFWAEDLNVGNRLNFQLEMYKGERFRTALLKKIALFPTKSGELTVTPFELTVPVHVRRQKRKRNDIFDDFFNDSFFGRSQTVEHVARSRTLKIKVDPLPEKGKPASFFGAVGEFNMDAVIDKNKVKTNEAVSLRLTISGKGNIKLLNVPEVKLPAGFEKYDPKTSEKINQGNTITGRKTAEYLIVPRIPGKKVVPPVEFSYYNTKTKKYVTLKSPEFIVEVEKGSGDYQPVGSGFSKEDVKLLNDDIRFIATSDFNLIKTKKNKLLPEWFWLMILVPPFILLGVVMVKRQKDKLSGNVELMKFKKAEKAARSRLKKARTALDSGNVTEFYTEVSLALSGYLEDKLAISKSEFTVEKVIEILLAKNVEKELCDKLKAIADKCEYARFAPGGDEANRELLEETVELIIKIDSAVKGKK